jgi:hypothetical protein
MPGLRRNGYGNLGGVEELLPCHGRPYSLTLTLPPFAIGFLVGPVAE